MQSFRISGGLPQLVTAHGRQVRYIDSNADALGIEGTLIVRAGNREIAAFQPGESFTLPEAVQQIEVIPANAALVAFVQVGDARIHSPHDPRAVAMFAMESARTALGREFIMGLQRTAVAGNSSVGVHNVGAGRIEVRSFLMTSSAADNATLFLAEGVPTVFASASFPKAMVAGRPDSMNARLFAGDSTTNGVLDFNAFTTVVNLGARRLLAGELPACPAGSIILPPGWGLYVTRSTALAQLGAVAHVSALPA